MFLSTTLRRATTTSTRLGLVRAYTIPTSKPVDGKANQDTNPLHALYNNENQSVNDNHLKQETKDAKQRTLSEEEEHEHDSNQINSVFD
ncbi:hypothetical protein K501DRAFT_286231, partial [Backusella circina FSU 941]